MKKITVLVMFLLVAILSASWFLAAGPRQVPHYSAAQVERGKFLVSIGGCNDCHTPWKFDAELGAAAPDMSRMLSGHPEAFLIIVG